MEFPAPVSSSYCVPNVTQLVVKRIWNYLGPIEYTVEDGEGSLRFETKSEYGFFLDVTAKMIDAVSGNVLLTILDETPCCGRRRWMAFHGDSESESELLLTFDEQTALLAGNMDSPNPDFHIQKTYGFLNIENGFTILSQGRIIAEAERNWSGTVSRVNIQPGVDQAFIAALTLMWMMVAYLHAG